MAIQAATEGLGVALGRTHLVAADIAAGRLVVPFDTVLPQDAGLLRGHAGGPDREPEDQPVPRLAAEGGQASALTGARRSLS